ncbi:MAG: xylan 1,4-beta-xylosidase [Ruminococcaceae bacterium]|nr:xylan 1,4-beta-xylosidase [Oscillospiraceae bacterium]
MAKKKRFVKIHSEGSLSCFEIWVDTETGVNYLFRQSGYSGGMTVLLDRNGNPVVSPLPIKEED